MSEYGINVFAFTGESCRISDSGLGYAFSILSGTGSITASDHRQSQVEFVCSQSGVAAQIESDPIGAIDRILLFHYTSGNHNGDALGSPFASFRGMLDHNLRSVVYANNHISSVTASGNQPIYLIGLFNIFGA